MSIIHKLPYEWQVGLRYTRAGKRSGRSSFISFISLISVAGIALGVAALIIVLSVMNGFQKQVTDRMLSVLAHIEVFDASGSLPDWRASAQEALRNPNVLGAAPFVETQGLLVRDGVMRPSIVRGVLPGEEDKVSTVARQVRAGSFDALKPGSFNIVLGYALARALGVGLGDKVTMVLAQGQVTPAGMVPRTRSFTVAGIFEAGHFDFDAALSFIHVEDAQRLERLPAPSGLRLRIANMREAPEVAEQLKGQMSGAKEGNLTVRDWPKLNANWYAAVQTEKKMMFIILTLIIAVAAFNLVSSLVMTVTEKQADIAILRTLGSSPQSIMKIFMVQGGAIGVLGTLAGVGMGVAVSLNIDVIVPFIERLLGVEFLSKDIYLISTVPSDLHGPDVAVIGVISVLLAFAATVYPSWAASRVKPAEALRYE
ncbi:MULTISPECIES: lipoprotein-releasing ABC transporter permease subunit [Massilia]|jgi:lipoprotein-releasing system permease protein|uniref:lipoprotein-releasing ABC transporter permease subunit n=1 Tax=Massilia TaxID=149698 RepID=UPI001C62F17C|nr:MULTISPECIES: lipoprotein-releasing ABC transporter permease subunit [Massilia]QYG02504.1 lipoprotein-releasing ABC transporter permease subunit [Massilia sp. NP310]